MKEIVKLGFDSAVKAIDGTKTVMYKHGVWNPYYERSTEDVKKSIMNSGYGADVDFNEKNGMFYVEIPCDADMW